MHLSRAAAATSIGVVAFPLWLGFARNGALDPDESQHLHAAWLVAQGRVPYVDFWEHHMPLVYYLLAPLTRRFVDSPDVYFAGRVVMVAVTGAALMLLYLVARRVGSRDGALAVALFCVQPSLIQYTTQVRPDVPALFTWLAALLALIRWRETGRARWIWSTGLLLGVTAAFSPKAAYEIVGVTIFIGMAAACGRVPRRSTLTALLRLTAGSAAPVVLLCGWVWATGGDRAIRGFVRSVVIDNVAFPDSSKRLPFGVEGVALVLLAGAGVFIVGRRLRLRAITDPVHGPLLVPALVISILLLLPTTPAVYEYTWLPVTLAATIYAAIGVRVLITIRRERFWWSTLLVLVAIGAFVYPAMAATAAALRNRNAAALRDMQRELTYACPNDAVFDGTGLYVFRRSASRYAALVVGVRRRIGFGQIPVTSVIAELRSARAPVGLWDRRLRIIGGPIAAFAARYYVRQPDGLLLLGTTVVPPRAGEPGRAAIELLRDTLYRVGGPIGDDLRIDGAAVSPGLLRLTAGTHSVTWSGLSGPVDITASTCAERLAAGPVDG